MKKTIIISLCVITIISIFLITLYPPKKLISSPIKNESSNFILIYIVKEFKGKIAIFEKDKESPFRIIDTPVSNLPKIDQELLAQGIEIENEDDLDSLIEDYCS